MLTVGRSATAAAIASCLLGVMPPARALAQEAHGAREKIRSIPVPTRALSSRFVLRQWFYLTESALRDSLATTVRDSVEWSALWRRIIGTESTDSAAMPVPRVDFTREMVIAFGLGEEFTYDGWRLGVESAARRGDTLVVRIRRSVRAPRCFPHNDGHDSPLALATTPRLEGPTRFVVHQVVVPCPPLVQQSVTPPRVRRRVSPPAPPPPSPR